MDDPPETACEEATIAGDYREARRTTRNVIRTDTECHQSMTQDVILASRVPDTGVVGRKPRDVTRVGGGIPGGI